MLREYADGDWQRVHEYRADPRYLRYYPEVEGSVDEVRDFIAMVTGWAAVTPRTKYQLAITRASDGLLIGSWTRVRGSAMGAPGPVRNGR